MSSFNDLTAVNGQLYRGSHGAVSREVMSLAVGPVRAVAEFIRDSGLDVPDGVRDAAAQYFTRALTQPDGQPQVQGAPTGQSFAWTPGEALADRLDHLLKLPRIAANVFTAFEHVLYEPEAQINSPRTGRLLESVSTDPQTAILYAYGIDPDAWLKSRQANYWHASPSQEAFVAVLPSSAGLGVDGALSHLGNLAAPAHLTDAEARRRMQRDSEVLLTTTVQPVALFQLPGFDPTDIAGSMDNAADALKAKGVAQ